MFSNQTVKAYHYTNSYTFDDRSLERGRDTSCLDLRSQSQTLAHRRVSDDLHRRISLYPSGEIELTTVVPNRRSPPPQPRSGRRLSRGVSRRGRKQIRRAVESRTSSDRSCRPVLITLTVRDRLDDRYFKKLVSRWLSYGRKYDAPAFAEYVVAYELQDRGVLHAHLILFDHIDKDVFLRLRRLWSEMYTDSPGGVDIKPVGRQSRAASVYLSKVSSYIGKDDDDSRMFAGNAYAISDALRLGMYPVSVTVVPWSDDRARDLLAMMWRPNDWSGYLRGLSLSQARELLRFCGLAPPSSSDVGTSLSRSHATTDQRREILRQQARHLLQDRSVPV